MTPGPIAFAVDAARVQPHLTARQVPVSSAVEQQLRGVCASVTTDPAALAEASRDWWPLAMTWALAGEVGGLAGAVVRPATVDEVSAVLRLAHETRVPVTPAAGRSGVSGGSVPLHGGIVLDLSALGGIVDVDTTSMVLDVRAGTFGDELEERLRADHRVTLGHWPQSMALSTVGGWLACRGAGQLSTRYGKIEDIVEGLDVVLADGTLVHTGGAPRAAVGPDLTQVFVGSEGTLGIIVGARLRAHRLPDAEVRGAFEFGAFVEGLDAMRAIIQRGATPAVLRLYDATEADRSYQTGAANVLLMHDEADAHVVEATRRIVDEECTRFGGVPIDIDLVGRWMEHRNDVSALEALISRGFVVDTMEVSGEWRALPDVYARTIEAIKGVEHTIAASAHQSHSYTSGACLYFTFAGKPPEDQREQYYRAAWDAGQRAVLAAGGALSHHHGIGLNRSRFVRDALGSGLDVLQSVKDALDPNGILNPGKLGLRNPFGDVAWP
jgi:alkyldihydroxyacetonephosphate synthase